MVPVLVPGTGCASATGSSRPVPVVAGRFHHPEERLAPEPADGGGDGHRAQPLQQARKEDEEEDDSEEDEPADQDEAEVGASVSPTRRSSTNEYANVPTSTARTAFRSRSR
jgi:hypothetical protein